MVFGIAVPERLGCTAIVLAILASSPVNAQTLKDWVAPEDARDLSNPLGATPENLKRGRMLYLQHCQMCHGTQGRGDGPNARMHTRRSLRAPRDLSRPDVQAGLSDGEMFWKITNGWKHEGRIIMPALGEEVSPPDRWSLVLYVRSLRKDGPR
jgi:mono/diheme cytochrome c family protein